MADRQIVPEPQGLPGLPEGVHVGPGQIHIQGYLRVLPAGREDVDGDFRFAPEDCFSRQGFQPLIQIAVSSGRPGGELKVAVVDRFDFHQDIPLFKEPLGASIAGHAFQHTVSLLVGVYSTYWRLPRRRIFLKTV